MFVWRLIHYLQLWWLKFEGYITDKLALDYAAQTLFPNETCHPFCWISNRKHVEDLLILKLQAWSPHTYVEIANAMNIGNRTINPNNSKVEPLLADVKSKAFISTHQALESVALNLLNRRLCYHILLTLPSCLLCSPLTSQIHAIREEGQSSELVSF